MPGKQYEYDAMARCEKELWWYRNLHNLTIEKINQFSYPSSSHILDAGCGTGGMLAKLEQNNFTNIQGFDLSSDAIAYARRNVSSPVQLLDILKVDENYLKASFDIIISHDILCMLKEPADKLAFDKLVTLLKPGGLLLMNLPAGKLFKGTHDIAVGIAKRYTKAHIKELAANSIEIKEIIYWPFLLSPLIFSVRLLQRIKTPFVRKGPVISDVKLPPFLLNKVFNKLTSWENTYIHRKPWGSSIFIVAKKTDASQ
jgi:SAM-dependent methyltransferase